MRCRVCGKSNTISEFEPHRGNICKACYYKNRKPRMREYLRKYNRQLKLDAMEKCGGAKCACCGETKLEFLVLDHKDGGGSKWRSKMGMVSGSEIYRWMRRNKYKNIKMFRVLCHNCNFAIGAYGKCPHGGE